MTAAKPGERSVASYFTLACILQERVDISIMELGASPVMQAKLCDFRCNRFGSLPASYTVYPGAISRLEDTEFMC